MIKKITKCRVCNNPTLIPLIDLGEQYLTGIFPKSKSGEKITKGPLRLVKCHSKDDCCGLLQLEHSYESAEMYGENYGYRSGLNASMVRHLQDKVAKIKSIINLSAGDLVIDIGSNDGTTLSAYPKDLLLVGIDPTGEKFSKYYPPHIHLIPKFFSSDACLEYTSSKKAKVVTSFSMFYDLEDPISFASQISSILDPIDGIWVFEQSYMPLMLERNAYDTICHEHVEYYGLSQIMWIMDKAGLRVIDVELNDINGGSFSVIAALKESNYTHKNKSVEALLEKEKESGLDSLKPYEDFFLRTNESRTTLLEFISEKTKLGFKFAAIGASTKGNVLLQYCNLDETSIFAIGDVNPEKFNSFTPGTHIPIQDEKIILEDAYDYLIVLPWHFRSFFEQNPLFKGKKLVFPLPILEIVEVMQ
ncbi:class I SAM-dependent methyltransferase [Polynucleobacter necessarius]|uniref:class I SAM-dependent methyltransferase n=1 Tax=Polynucleobacter necessarius TaxID=576610 RepID=UPI000E09835A|nr:class I SAM-dependent methyltransferase [Polynucleobacter necessarius]HAT39071.1 methyltransferase [Polynucleobacter sp.]